MLTCVPRSKQAGGDHTLPAMKTLTSQIKEMALKASGSCTPCAGPPTQQIRRSNDAESDSSAERSYRRTGSSGRLWGKEMEARLKGISMQGSTSAAGELASGRYDPIVLIEEIEPKEWVAQVEPGVLITFISLPRGGNDLKRIRFSREMFNKWQAQRWWQENFDKVMELYNVRRLNRQAFSLPTPPKSEDEPPLNLTDLTSSKMIESIPLAPTLSKERLADTMDLVVNPKVSNISATKTETSSEELSISKVSDVDNEWVEQVEAGVYITIRVLPGGSRELRRVRFSREKFGEVHARLWWDENRTRIQKQYL